MNKHDLNNLYFIMSLKREELPKWFHSISSDEQDYALEILMKANLEAAEFGSALEEPTDFSLAKQVLGRFTLKGELF